MKSLSPFHEKEIKRSAIGKAEAKRRGYRTITDPSDLLTLGFTKKQCRVPGLLVPMFAPDGSNGVYQFKPSQPRTVQGKEVKYETPKGSRVRLDCPPGLGDRLADSGVPLWVTEGVKKADAAVTAGLCCIALQGVDCWRNANGPLAEWADIALRDREVFIAFDSDVMTKDSVRLALDALTKFLRHQGAVVLWVTVPDNGDKVGLDDYLARGGSVEDLTASAYAPTPGIRTEGQQSRELTREAIHAMQAANRPPKFFQRDTGLVYAGPLGVAAVDKDRMRHLLGEVADWYVVRSSKKGTVRRPVEPPVAVVSNVLNAYELWPFPVLDRIVTTPVFAPDGSLRTEPGYHEASRSLFVPSEGLVVPPVADAPSQSDVKRAKKLVKQLFQDFVFVGDADRAHAWAMLLQPFARELIRGSTPLYGVEAPKQGTGKTLLVQSAMAPAIGIVDSYAEPHGNEEMDKVITASLIEAMPVLFFDNVERFINYPALASALTKPTWTGRVLGQSAKRTIPVTCSFVLTANNPRYSDDMTRRVARIRLDANEEDPSQRKGFALSLPAWALENRGDLIWAACTLIRSWVVAGRPGPDRAVPLMGSYGPWRRVIGGILGHVGVPGFLDNIADATDELSPAQETFESIFEVVAEEYGDGWFMAKELAEALADGEADAPVIRGNTPEQMAQGVGYFLRSHRNQVIKKHRLERGPRERGGYPWRFKRLGAE